MARAEALEVVTVTAWPASRSGFLWNELDILHRASGERFDLQTAFHACAVRYRLMSFDSGEGTSMSAYRDRFFKIVQYSSRRSAEVTVPFVIELLQPRSVVDVGCGTGEWLATFRAHGVERLRGLDGSYVPPSFFAIPADSFTPIELAKPFSLHETFDLAMSLEVAEHLPTESAQGFVASLVRLAPVILFSAATPGQKGVNHINCQWPEYWANLFAGHDYMVIDCLRDRVWDNPHVAPWYAQNILLFATKSALDKNPLLYSEAERTRERPLARAHPGLQWWRLTPRLIYYMVRASLTRSATRI